MHPDKTMTIEVAFALQFLAVSEMLAHPPGVNCHRGASLSSDLQRGGHDWAFGIVEERGFWREGIGGRTPGSKRRLCK